jgi:hypothetical protein
MAFKIKSKLLIMAPNYISCNCPHLNGRPVRVTVTVSHTAIPVSPPGYAVLVPGLHACLFIHLFICSHFPVSLSNALSLANYSSFVNQQIITKILLCVRYYIEGQQWTK